MFYSHIQPQPDLKRPDADLWMTKSPESAPDAGGHERQLRLAFGRNFRDLRRAKKKTQSEIAQAIGSEQSYIGKIERGEQNITLDTVQKLAAAVGVPAPQILLASPPVGSLTLDVLNRMASALSAKLSDLLKEHGATGITLDMVDTILRAMLAEARQVGSSQDTSSSP